jgi:hypothetical protein
VGGWQAVLSGREIALGGFIMAKKDENTFDLGGSPVGVGASADTEGMIFNLNDVDEPSFEVLPKGTYPAIVDEFEYTTSQSSGNPMIRVVYQITEGEFAERKLYDYLVLAGDGAKFAIPRLKQMLIRVCPEVDISSFNPAKFADEGTILNRPCQIKVNITTQKSGEYKGEKRNQIREVLAASDAGSSFLG